MNMAGATSRKLIVATGFMALALGGCSNYIKRAEFDSTVAGLRATDQQLQGQIDSLSQKYDAVVTQLAGRTRVETGAHFETGDATLSDQDKPLLDDFARVIRDRHSDAVVTVEGFADPAGSTAFNRRLGQRRAEAIRDYLTANGGLAASQVRAVSYGEDKKPAGAGGRDRCGGPRQSARGVGDRLRRDRYVGYDVVVFGQCGIDPDIFGSTQHPRRQREVWGFMYRLVRYPATH